jgi:mannose-6-phosphate isomerase-like protein (cupin superfamily)
VTVPEPPRIITLDDIEALPGPGTLTWLPVRATLDIRAFGTNAYVAASAGEDVVEPHTEESYGHQELYFVARGRATFTIDGETHDAPAGTYVFLPDPASRRHAVAAEAGTTVLSFGGPPTFEPSAWEWSFRAAALQRTDPAAARAVLADGLGRFPDDAGLHYGVGCLEALSGNADAALEALRQATELNPKARRWAADDEDLVSLRDDPRFQALLAG